MHKLREDTQEKVAQHGSSCILEARAPDASIHYVVILMVYMN
jgi:hypothetical protein